MITEIPFINKIKLSLKKTWYSLIILAAAIPAILMLIWGGTNYYQLLLEKNQVTENFFRELAVDHVNQEVERLSTMLINKSDPMAYTLARNKNIHLLNELLRNVVEREPSVHMLLVIDANGEFIAGNESHNNYKSDKEKKAGLAAHWHFPKDNLPIEVSQALKGKPYISQVFTHSEGVFFILSNPIGPTSKPLAALIAHVDANILWNDLSSLLQRDNVTSYLVDSKGFLLTSPEQSMFNIGDSISNTAIETALNTSMQGQINNAYQGILGKPVFANLSKIDTLGLSIISEVEKESILEPIRELFFNLIIGATLIVMLLFGLSSYMVRRVIKPLDSISADFKRVGRQDYTPSSTSSPFEELQILVDCFNHMVKEIKNNQQDLKQAAMVFENTSEGIVITDSGLTIISVNRAFTDITGYTEEDIVGKKISILKSGKHDLSFYKSMWKTIRKTGKWRGEICNRKKNGDIYTELLSINTLKNPDVNSIYHIGVFNDISYIKETESKLAHLAHHDPLTNLPNRLLCQARMERELEAAKRNKKQVAILFLDLDMFKTVNDSMGHAKGDALLQQVASRISNSLRREDTVARLGGDEFVIIIGALNSRQGAAIIAKNILALFSTTFIVDGTDIFISASIGISLYPDDGKDTQVLLRNADSAMYQAKASGRNNFQFYTPALTKIATQRLNIESSLRQALEKNQLLIYYQPQYSLHDNKIIAVEALLRWNHPQMGMVSPDKFISVAEETGLIIPIGEWVLKTACLQQIQWLEAGYDPIRMAVNVSTRQFWKPGLDKAVENIIKETGIKASDLELELTESIILHDTLSISDTLFELHNMGVGLSIDDFGTGYSSLSYIQRFPLVRLKIDQSFIQDITRNPDDAAMITSIIALGHSMKLQVLAEGVETKEQLEFLQHEGCDEVQGYYFSRPVAPTELEKLLHKSPD